jgi:hypothetical protein
MSLIFSRLRLTPAAVTATDATAAAAGDGGCSYYPERGATCNKQERFPSPSGGRCRCGSCLATWCASATTAAPCCRYICTLDVCTLDVCTLGVCTLDVCTLDICTLDVCTLDVCTLTLAFSRVCVSPPGLRASNACARAGFAVPTTTSRSREATNDGLCRCVGHVKKNWSWGLRLADTAGCCCTYSRHSSP